MGVSGDEVTNLEAKIDELASRYSRVERAILGDPNVGHIGLITRMERVEEDHRAVPGIHQGIEDRRSAADDRTHDHINRVEAQLNKRVEDARTEALDEIQKVEDANARANRRIEGKVDKLRWTVAGGATAIVGAATWLVFAVGG